MTVPRSRVAAALVTLVSLLAVAGCGVVGTPGGRHYSALFRTATGVYPNADVRVLGVAVGKIDAVVPQGEVVRVEFHVNSDVQVPADARAVVVAPTVVADRYVQLTPVYTGGPTLPEGTVLPVERTASPAEFDDLLAAAQKLSRSLGPDGANANGALSQALTTAARNLSGNGERLNTTLDNTSQAVTTLAANRENLAGTIRDLQSFISNLQRNDPQLRAFIRQFAEVNGFLADERQNLGETLTELSQALGEVARFVHDNRAEIKENVEQLSDVLETINNERIALEQVLESAPFGLDGLVNGYNAGSATLDTRPNLLGSVLCGVKLALPMPLADLFAQLVRDFFPDSDPLAGCDKAGRSGLIGLSPAMKAQLSDPRVASALGELLRRRAATAGDTPRAPSQAPAAGLPLTDRGATGTPLVPDLKPQPPPAPTLGDLLRGGR